MTILHRLLQSLEPARFALLKYLMSFLSEVAAYEDENLMSPHNLAIVFAPNLLHQAPPEPGLALAVECALPRAASVG